MLFVSRREYTSDMSEIRAALREHQTLQDARHKENQSLLMKIMMLCVGGLVAALWEIVAKGVIH